MLCALKQADKHVIIQLTLSSRAEWSESETESRDLRETICTSERI